MRKNKRLLITLLIFVGVVLLAIAYNQFDKWYSPAKREFNSTFNDFTATHPKQICSESLGGQTDNTPHTFYHVYYYSDNPNVEKVVIDSAKPRGYKLTEDLPAEKQRVSGYNDHTTYLAASSNFGSLNISIAPAPDKVTLYCGSLGNYKNYGKTITPGSGQRIIEFRVTKQ